MCWLLCVYCSDMRVCAFACLSGHLRNEETSFLNSAGNVQPNYINKAQVILVFMTHGRFWLFSSSTAARAYVTRAHAHTPTHTHAHWLVTFRSHSCGQNLIALRSAFWLWAAHTSLSYIQYSTYINFLILNYLWGLEDLGHAPSNAPLPEYAWHL